MEFSFREANIKLRPFEPEDAPALYPILNHPEILGRRYIPWGFPNLTPLTRQQVDAVLKKWAERENGLRLAVVLQMQQEERLVGYLALDWGWDAHSPSLSVVVSPDYQRQGIGSTALGIGLRYLFEYTPAHCASADWIADWNLPARHFLEKQGFKKTASRAGRGCTPGAPIT